MSSVQRSQLRFNGSEPGFSWRSFPDRWRLPNRISDCAVMVSISVTVCDVAEESELSLDCHVGKPGTP